MPAGGGEVLSILFGLRGQRVGCSFSVRYEYFRVTGTL